MSQKKIMIIGDIMLDKFSYGRVNRLNPESPAQLINIEREECKLWGAANVAANIISLGGQAILIGQIGADKNGDIFQSLSQQQGIVFKGVINPEISTTSKERVIEMTYHQQLIRMDYENIVEIQESQMEDILSFLSDSPPDFIIISDYKKGCITEYFARRLIDTGIPIIVDTKPGRLAWFRGALAIKPNFKEFSEHIGVKWENSDIFIEAHGMELARSLGTNLVITRSEQGVSIIEKSGAIRHIPTEAQAIFDVTGAWDTFIAAMTVALADGKNIIEAAQFGNRASGMAVGKVGTTTITRKELE